MDKIKKLEAELDELQTALASLKSQKLKVGHTLKQTIDRLKQVADEIHDLKFNSKEISISDHAIVRYLERVEKMDIEEVKKKIVTDKVRELIDKLGNGVFPVNDVFKITVNDKVITTVMTNEQKTSNNIPFSKR